MACAKRKRQADERSEAARIQPDPWEIVELIEDGATGAPIWISISNIAAVYSQEPGDEESEPHV